MKENKKTLNADNLRRHYYNFVILSIQELKINYDYSIPCRTSCSLVFKALANPYSIWESYDVANKQRFFHFVFEANLQYDKKEGYRTPLTTRLYSVISGFGGENIGDVGNLVKRSNQSREFALYWTDFFKHNPATAK